MIVKFRLRRDTAANWTANNPTLAVAEPGLETDTLRVKYGDGVTAWNDLDYSASVVGWSDITGKPANLTAIAGLTTAADEITYWTGSGTAAQTTLTSYIRTLLDDGNAATARGTLGAASSGANSDITSLAGLTTPLSVAQGGTGGDLSDAWTTYTPTISALSGSLTSAAAAGRYLKIGRLVHFQVKITITTNGTGAAAIVCSLPFGTRNVDSTFSQAAVGREVGVTGKSLNGELMNNSTTMYVSFYDASYPGGDGYVLIVNGHYEAS
jgi:hypothetical protein